MVKFSTVVLCLTATLVSFAIPASVFADDTIQHPTLIRTHYATSDYVIATAVATDAPFKASSDGVTDAAAAIQEAIDQVAGEGGGVVFLPSGRYLCRQSIVIKEGVTLRGDWSPPNEKTGSCTVAGTILMPVADRGNPGGTPFILLQRGSGVRDLNVWYPDQSSNSVEAYPWTIASDPDRAGNNYTVEQVTLVNSYLGIRFGPEFNEMFTVRQVFGAPLKIGLTADSVTDIGRVIDMQFAPRYWALSGLPGAPTLSSLTSTLQSSAVGVDMQRSDWQYFYNVGISGYSVGIRFRAGKAGATIGVLYETNVAGGETAVLVDELANGLEFTRCRLEGAAGALVATSRFAQDLQFNDCNLIGENAPAISVAGVGSVRLQNSMISSTSSAPSVRLSAGSLSALACSLPGMGPRIELEKKVERAIISGCIFQEPLTSALTNHSHGAVTLDGRMIASTKPTYPDVDLPADRRPLTSALFNVLDYGASRVSTVGSAFPGTSTMVDSTAAFQRALDAAGAKGGGTVFVPAGFYLFNGNLQLPHGVELRGCFDVPHHTVSLGSVLLPTAGRGDEHAAPFIELEPGSGARGLTIWYPDQMADHIVPYPWTFRALGSSCWLIDDSVANPYRLADFGTFPCKDHLIRYVSGSPLREGIWVSKAAGVVDSCHFNAHEWVRVSPQSPPLASRADFDSGDAVIDYQQRFLNAYVFGSCGDEFQANNFVYGCSNGLDLAADGGQGCGGWVINHASDGSSTGVRVEAAANSGCQIINTQIATVGPYKNRAFSEDATCTGKVLVFGGISFGQTDVPTMSVLGTGTTVIEGWYSSQMEAVVGSGDISLDDCLLPQPLGKTVTVESPTRSLYLIANSAGPGAFTWTPSANVVALDNSAATPMTPLKDRFLWPSKTDSSFLPDISPQNNNQNVDSLTCKTVTSGQTTSTPAIEISGTATAHSHNIAYYHIFDVNLPVASDTVFRYWIKPGNAAGQHTGVDLIFSDGTALRDLPVSDIYGKAMHPIVARGVVGQWSRIECHLGPTLQGRTVAQIVLAYDNTNSAAQFESKVSSIEIGEPISSE